MAKKKLFYETDNFLKLKSKWYAKLKKAGFEDIEEGETDTILNPQVFKTEKSQYDGGNQYFELCQEVLREYKFKRNLHKAIFGKHAEGLSLRQIKDWLLKTHSISLSVMGIKMLIDRIKSNYLIGITK